MVKLSRGTTITQIPNTNFPDTYFDFLPHERLHERTAAHSPLTDYIARFNCIITDKKTPAGKLLLKLQVEDTRANFTEIAIWEAVTKTINRQSLNNAPFPTIIAVTSLRVSIRDDMYQLASTPATHLYLNPPIDLAKEIATSFKDRFNAITIQTRNMITLKDLLEKKTADHLQQRFVCNAWITSWNENKSWFYRGCKKCNKKVEKRGGIWTCTNHPKEEEYAYVYCISGTLTDDTTTATAILFDAAMESFVNTTCSEMIYQYTEKDTIPDPIQALKGQPKIFEVQFNKQSYAQSTQLVINRILKTSIPNIAESSQPGSLLNKTASSQPQTPTQSTPTTAPKDTPPSSKKRLLPSIQDTDNEGKNKRLKEDSP
ncbi:hypothetical protein M8C21_030864 [Ambrosia artemisiifolia]|uniref:Replication factor A C-terminal domain-containing protein n=1 Tax=Ambrosia artemisiifolia TaxID=4212 RepID=A0AAD5CKF3_AMBAR|nr:hypothetical protein M8C21_030864 [Ambrosia artemisiifolia]